MLKKDNSCWKIIKETMTPDRLDYFLQPFFKTTIGLLELNMLIRIKERCQEAHKNVLFFVSETLIGLLINVHKKMNPSSFSSFQLEQTNFDRFFAMASSTARNCFKSSSRRDFLDSFSAKDECVGDDAERAETPTVAGFLISMEIGDLFFGGSTEMKKKIVERSERRISLAFMHGTYANPVPMHFLLQPDYQHLATSFHDVERKQPPDDEQSRGGDV
uniref:Uncharacterized protein n=1 Tax=Glossina austeni TaxID=7395 RepID=A0A1A9VNF3_GLOAU